MQAKRDYVWTILGWSFLGNFVGIMGVQYVDKYTNRWKTAKHFRKREVMKILAFVGCVGMFTVYGYGRARQELIR